MVDDMRVEVGIAAPSITVSKVMFPHRPISETVWRRKLGMAQVDSSFNVDSKGKGEHLCCIHDLRTTVSTMRAIITFVNGHFPFKIS